MWNRNERTRTEKMALAGGGYAESIQERRGQKKLSAFMAIIVGLIITLEIMVGAAMLFSIDVRALDGLAVLFTFAVIYFGVVAGLTDR